MMQEGKHHQMDDTIRLVRWLSEHPKIQSRLCEGEYESTPEECIEMIEMLEKHSFYDMIFILLMKNRHDPVIDEALTKMVTEKIANEWERIGTEQMCRDIKERIRKEIKINEVP
ncbi:MULTISPECIES: hypothetical protein [Dehalobacter]|uniref:Uncharacterized protein n=1 Tax=Dehalobacter restrictus TaxID=55583 RepID=A0A857DEW3_9FIRM|nr:MULTISPECIES: hypothetical protein [Dehalobacter]AFV03466.1 hypothetical protein DHBDCA_p2439 [Dehalobacter sp. DCA]AFV06453.1 hypothetical protein DCF50_p2450 [Dehalobacter sp. CF]EQB22347.1 hypothetical protein UNSWDHB_300 [Dehalobacter sp. UNSWDHB]MCG1025266.1 hypothetical protein [Dehalobacter sp.]OCZ52306.1 hypothetical protein A7D23_10985 [Dehalobacter sp. TeCB1]